jgi:predicted RND superfamily exporter protein
MQIATHFINQRIIMNSRFLTVLTLATVTVLSFSSLTKAETIAQTDVQTPADPAVIQDRTQTATDINSQSVNVEQNSNNTQSDSTNKDLPSNSAANVDKCGEQ